MMGLGKTSNRVHGAFAPLTSQTVHLSTIRVPTLHAGRILKPWPDMGIAKCETKEPVRLIWIEFINCLRITTIALVEAILGAFRFIFG